jgi:hypothetical protein
MDNIKDVVESVITTYNNDKHRSLNHKTPNQVFKDDDEQQIKHIHDTSHNQNIYNQFHLIQAKK